MNLKAEFSSQIRIVCCCYSAERIPALPWKCAFTSSFFARIASSHNKKTKRVASGQWKQLSSELGSSLCAKDGMNMKEIFILLLNLYSVFSVQAIRGEFQIYILFYPSIVAFLFVSVSFFQLMLFLIFCLLFCFLLPPSYMLYENRCLNQNQCVADACADKSICW